MVFLLPVLAHPFRRLLASCFSGTLVRAVDTFTVLLKVLAAFFTDGKGHWLDYGLQLRCGWQQRLTKPLAQGAVGKADTKHRTFAVQRQAAVFLVVVGALGYNQLFDVSFLLSRQLTIGFGHRQLPPFFGVGSNIVSGKIYYSLTNRRNTGCSAELFFQRIKENWQNIFEGRFPAVYSDPKRYEHDGLDEDTDFEDEYEANDSDYIVDDEDEDENALWGDAEEDAADEEDTDDPPEKKRRKRKKKDIFADSDTDADDAEAEEDEKTRQSLAKEQRIIDELEADAKENPIEDDEDNTGDEQPERKLLKRELRAQALKRLEDSARTLKDYENLVAWYDRLDANRQRKERYHELFRSGDDVPLDYGASEDALCFPDTLNDVLTRQERKGDFIDTIFYCPYDIHELVTDGEMSVILRELHEDHKFLLFLSALRQYSSVKIAAIRGQTDRNIRKVRNTMLKKIRKKLLAALTEKVQAQQPLTLLEKEFLSENGVDVENGNKS